jgi:hypothetical protein
MREATAMTQNGAKRKADDCAGSILSIGNVSGKEKILGRLKNCAEAILEPHTAICAKRVSAQNAHQHIANTFRKQLAPFERLRFFSKKRGIGNPHSRADSGARQSLAQSAEHKVCVYPALRDSAKTSAGFCE